MARRKPCIYCRGDGKILSASGIWPCHNCQGRPEVACTCEEEHDGPLEALAKIEEECQLFNPRDEHDVWCLFCAHDRPGHEDDCPFALLRRHLEPQPIESAPRDGSDVLVFCPVAVAWVIAVFVDGAWVSDTAEHKPTHWLPLPAPANQER